MMAMVELGAMPSGGTQGDTLVREHLPATADWPDLRAAGNLGYPDNLNVAAELLDRHVREGRGQRPALWFEGHSITYAELHKQVNRLAHVLTMDLEVKPGNRVLLRGFNTPMMVVAWLAVLKVGGVLVTTMPLLRARELEEVIRKARVQVALCDARLEEELRLTGQRLGAEAPRTVLFGNGSLEAMAASKSDDFTTIQTAA